MPTLGTAVPVDDLPLLTGRAQNRALLARQLLLTRSTAHAAADALEHLVGLQAQTPKDPYFGLWSRLEGFDPHAVGTLLTERQAVRMTLMRATVHLVTAPDAPTLRRLVQPMIERAFTGAWGRRIRGVELDALTAAAHAVLDRCAEPLSGRELAARVVAEHGIAGDAEAIRHAINVRLALVQVPPRGVWGQSGQPKYARLDTWTGCDCTPRADLDDVVLRYLRAFGPASVADFQKWSGLTRCADAFGRLRRQLIAFRSESGRELFDLREAARPNPDTPAPVRFLPEYDNVLLSHADRTHVIPGGETPWLAAITAGHHVGNVLIDGLLRATWWVQREDRRRIVLTVRPLGAITRSERAEVRTEAQRLADFAGATTVQIGRG